MRKPILLVVILFFTTIGMRAQVSDSIVSFSSFQQAWDYALKNNPDQKTYLLNIEKARSDKRTSQSFLWPSLSGSFAGQYNGNLPTTPIPGELSGKPGTVTYAQLGQKYAYNAGVSLSKSILNWQELAQLKIADNNILTSELQVDAYRQNLKQQVATYYYSVTISLMALHTGRQDLALADSIVVMTREKLDQGLINTITANQSEINRNNISQQIMNTETLLEQCKVSLKILCGLNITSGLQLSEIALSEQNDIPATMQNLMQDKNIAVTENQLKGYDYKITEQRAAFLPKLAFNSYIGAQQYRNNFGMTFGNNDWLENSYMGINIQVPIFNGFSSRSKVKTAKIEYEKAQYEHEENKRKTAINDNLLLYQFKQSWMIAQTSKENFRLYSENQQSADQKLKEGVMSLDDFFKISQDYLNAENAWLNALSVMYSNYSTIISRQ